MKLSEEESRYLDRWEKKERRWSPVTRWICLFNGVVMAVAGFFLVHRVEAIPMIDAGSLLFVHLFCFGGAGFWIAVAASKWRGNIRTRLFLRLIRESETKDG